MTAARLRQARERTGLRQIQVKERTGINNKTLSGYENEVSEPDLQTLSTLAGLYGVSVDWLTGRTDDMTPPPKATGSKSPSSRSETAQASDETVGPEQREFLKWVEENVSDTFFFDFDSSPAESKKQLMADLRYMWEREKKTGK
ncbi:MAG: helix-turn-helix domain-containing protein [Bacilli bacterium]